MIHTGMLFCNSFECEDYREFSVLCLSCKASSGNSPSCSIESLCAHCTNEFSSNCPKNKCKGDKHE
jgi:hypothetical protein